MLESDGFWNALSSLLFWICVITIIMYFKRDILNLIMNRNIKVRIGENEINIDDATQKLGEYITDLQTRVAAIEEKNSIDIVNGGGAELSENSNDKWLLWVDDYPSNNAFIVDDLRKRGVNVDISLSTDDAIKKFTAFDHRLIITDLGRKENGSDNPFAGLELIRNIRRVNGVVPILVFAGQRGILMRDKLIAEGANEVSSSGIDVMKFIEKNLS